MVATAIYSVTMVLWKKTHFLFAEPWKGVGKGMLSQSPGVFCNSGDAHYYYYYYYYVLLSHNCSETQQHAIYYRNIHCVSKNSPFFVFTVTCLILNRF